MAQTENASEAAFPNTWNLPNKYGGVDVNIVHGLTKRELFAKDILCALLSNSPQSQLHGFPEYTDQHHVIAFPSIAIRYADALLLALENQPAQ